MTMRESIGPFEIIAEIGRGGMGVVYLARQPSPDREVAVKVLSFSDPEFSVRLRREAELLDQLDDPHIVKVLDVGDDDGDPYYAMTYCAGGNIAQVLKRDGRLEPSAAVGVVAAVAEALATLHSRGLIHRDVKPSNVLLSIEGDVFLGDFGLAIAGDATRVTRSGTVFGTIGHSAPELLEGADVTPSSDTFSLGVLGYELLAGAPPFRGEHIAAVMDAIRSGRRVPLAEAAPFAPLALVQLVERALATDPAARPGDLRRFAREVRAIVPETRVAPAGATAGGGRDPDDDTLPEPLGLATVVHSRDDVETVIRRSGRRAVPATVPETEPRTRSRRGVLALAAALVVVVVAVAGVAVGRSPGSRAQVATKLTADQRNSYQLPIVRFANGVTVAESWAAAGSPGNVLNGTIIVKNPRAERVVHTQDVVIPKSLASSLADVDFATKPSSVVNADPIVRYCLTLAPKAQRVLRYEVTTSVNDIDDGHLKDWAKDWKRATDANYDKPAGAACRGAKKGGGKPTIDTSKAGTPTTLAGLASGTFAPGGQDSITVVPGNPTGPGAQSVVTSPPAGGGPVVVVTTTKPITTLTTRPATPTTKKPTPPLTSPPPTSPPPTSPPTTTAPAPGRSVGLAKGGSAAGRPGCSPSACAYLVVTMHNFSGGSHTVTCNASNIGEFFRYTTSATQTTNCYYGYQGPTVWATVDGVRSNDVRW